MEDEFEYGGDNDLETLMNEADEEDRLEAELRSPPTASYSSTSSSSASSLSSIPRLSPAQSLSFSPFRDQRATQASPSSSTAPQRAPAPSPQAEARPQFTIRPLPPRQQAAPSRPSQFKPSTLPASTVSSPFSPPPPRPLSTGSSTPVSPFGQRPSSTGSSNSSGSGSSRSSTSGSISSPNPAALRSPTTSHPRETGHYPTPKSLQKPTGSLAGPEKSPLPVRQGGAGLMSPHGAEKQPAPNKQNLLTRSDPEAVALHVRSGVYGGMAVSGSLDAADHLAHLVPQLYEAPEERGQKRKLPGPVGQLPPLVTPSYSCLLVHILVFTVFLPFSQTDQEKVKYLKSPEATKKLTSEALESKFGTPEKKPRIFEPAFSKMNQGLFTKGAWVAALRALEIPPYFSTIFFLSSLLLSFPQLAAECPLCYLLY